MTRLLKYWQYTGMGSGAQNYGLLTDLLSQSGNGSSNIKIKVASTHIPATYGNWASGTNYSKGSIRAYPSGSPVMWRCVNAISGAPNNTTPPGVGNSDWVIDIALDMIQDSGDGVNFFRTTLQGSSDDYVRLNNFQYGTYADAQFTNSVSNYEDFAEISPSASSIATNTAIPSSKSFTLNTGLSQLYNSVTLNASFSSTFSIPTTHPTTASYVIGTGLTISEGDTLTFYGDATHFFVFVVYRYDSATGTAYGFSTVNVGTGSFSTWSVKREVLLYGKWTGGAVDFFSVVTAYDSVTGSTSATMVASANTAGAVSGWDFWYGKRPQTIPSSQSTNFNKGGTANAVGHYAFVSFTGTSLQLKCITQNNGMGWLCVYVSGPDSGNPPVNVTVDTYSASSLTNQTKQAFSGLTYGTHRVVIIATTSPNGSSTNTTPFVYASTTTTNILSFNQNVNYDLFTSTIDIGLQDPNSAGEAAWNFRLNSNSGAALQWWPYHGVITDRDDSKAFVVDGVTISTNTLSSVVNPYLYKYQSFTSAQCVQVGAITHPDDAGDFATYNSVHTLNRSGLDYDIMVLWLKAALISAGYNNQVSMGESFFNKIKTINAGSSVYMSRPSDNTSVNMASNFKNNTSYLFYSTSGSSPAKDLVLGQFWPDVGNWRAGLSGSGTSFVQDFTGSAGAKFYPYAFNSYVTTVGEVMRIRNKLYLGKWANANANL